MVTSRWGIAEPIRPKWQRAESWELQGQGKTKKMRLRWEGRGGKGNREEKRKGHGEEEERREGGTGRERRVLLEAPGSRKWSLPWQLQRESSIPRGCSHLVLS